MNIEDIRSMPTISSIGFSTNIFYNDSW